MYCLTRQGPPGLNGPPGPPGIKVRYETLYFKQFSYIFNGYLPSSVSSVGLSWDSGFSGTTRFYWHKSKNREQEKHKYIFQNRICYTIAYCKYVFRVSGEIQVHLGRLWNQKLELKVSGITIISFIEVEFIFMKHFYFYTLSCSYMWLGLGHFPYFID